ncbi:hypothetical protein [Methanobrevibacter sp. UBA188]|uniref:hypothetical protein n=1 Tax=Methanobrevibacter sp. UBA188 TaxID=1915473 RepID=UPI0025FDA664|nr:hypothetical protein [Methanobrevibacter sp. UBA188]
MGKIRAIDWGCLIQNSMFKYDWIAINEKIRLGIEINGDSMHEIDGISIGDVNYDKVCLNCRHWRVEVQLKGFSKSVVCTKGQGHTNPSETCAMFSSNPSIDSVQNPNQYFDKKNKMDVWKL